MRGAPHSGFSMLICRISARSSVSICGRPPNERDFQRQYRRKPARCQRTSVSGRMILSLQDRRKPSIQLDKEQAIAVRKPDALMHYPAQHNHLVSKRSIFGFKPALQLEWRDQDGKDKTQQRDHCALTLGDSLPQSIRIRFSVHTGEEFDHLRTFRCCPRARAFVMQAAHQTDLSVSFIHWFSDDRTYQPKLSREVVPRGTIKNVGNRFIFRVQVRGFTAISLVELWLLSQSVHARNLCVPPIVFVLKNGG